MSTLVLVLAMAVPGIGPERESGEIVQESQPLDLSGEWKGIWKDKPNGEGEAIGYKDGVIYVPAGHFPSRIVDDGEGRLHFTERWNGYIGIYRQNRSQVIICYRDRVYGYPTSFRIGDGRHRLLILHRVKPQK
jgi:hypothetical protein